MENVILTDEFFMKEALKEARAAYDKDEVPVGAVVVLGDRIIAKAHNQVEALGDVTAHAEILAITAAENHLGTKFLNECTLYVSLEPCTMCAGAIGLSRLGRLVIGTNDEKMGFRKYSKRIIHPSTMFTEGVMGEESRELLRSWFKTKR